MAYDDYSISGRIGIDRSHDDSICYREYRSSYGRTDIDCEVTPLIFLIAHRIRTHIRNNIRIARDDRILLRSGRIMEELEIIARKWDEVSDGNILKKKIFILILCLCPVRDKCDRHDGPIKWFTHYRAIGFISCIHERDPYLLHSDANCEDTVQRPESNKRTKKGCTKERYCHTDQKVAIWYHIFLVIATNKKCRIAIPHCKRSRKLVIYFPIRECDIKSDRMFLLVSPIHLNIYEHTGRTIIYRCYGDLSRKERGTSSQGTYSASRKCRNRSPGLIWETLLIEIHTSVYCRSDILCIPCHSA